MFLPVKPCFILPHLTSYPSAYGSSLCIPFKAPLRCHCQACCFQVLFCLCLEYLEYYFHSNHSLQTTWAQNHISCLSSQHKNGQSRPKKQNLNCFFSTSQDAFITTEISLLTQASLQEGSKCSHTSSLLPAAELTITSFWVTSYSAGKN